MLKLDNQSIVRRCEVIFLMIAAAIVGYAAVQDVKIAVPPQCIDYVGAVKYRDSRNLIFFLSAIGAGIAAAVANIIISIAIRVLVEYKKENKQ
jgi:hypothetical protein